MTSSIDPNVPVTGNPTTGSVRANFQIAKDEITALQEGVNSTNAALDKANTASSQAVLQSEAAVNTANQANANSQNYSTQAQAEAGTAATTIMSPLRVSQAIQYQTGAQTGDIVLKAHTPAAGWLILPSPPVSRTTYASLYAKIGTKYGSGNGSTTFDLPPAPMTPAAAPNNARPDWYIKT